MWTPNGDAFRNEVDSYEESQPLTPPLLQFENSDPHENVNLKTPDHLIIPSLGNANLLTPRSVPNLRRRKDFPSSPLFPVDSSPSSLRKPSSLHAASINGDKAHLQHALSGSGLRLLESRDKFGRTPLIYACLGDRPECVAILLSAGSSTISADVFGRNAFHWAAIKGLYECYKIMFKHESKTLAIYGGKSTLNDEYIGWRMKDKIGTTPLHLSACVASTKCFSYILKNAAENDIDCQDAKKRTPLHWAATAGNAEAVRMLLKAKAKVGMLDEEGKPPLFHAASSVGKKPETCIKLLLEKSPDTITWQDNQGRSAFHLAVADQESSVGVIDSLLSHCKSWKEMKDKHEQTPLHWAAILGRTLSVRPLLSSFSETSSLLDMHGATPLHYAAMYNHPDIIIQMVDFDQKVIEVEDSEGRTALLWAANNDSCEAIQELVKHRANLEHSDKNGQSALHVASTKGFRSAAKMLLELGANVNAKDDIGNTPLASACVFGHLDIFELLMERGAEVDVSNIYLRKLSHVVVAAGYSSLLYKLEKKGADIISKDVLGLTPLHLACQEGSIDCTSILVENGAQCDVQDNEGCTPLYYAVAGGHEEVVEMLLDHAANVNILTFDGKTALDVCVESEHKILADLLSRYGAVSSNDMSITQSLTFKEN